jgi:hypothetical protein
VTEHEARPVENLALTGRVELLPVDPGVALARVRRIHCMPAVPRVNDRSALHRRQQRVRAIPISQSCITPRSMALKRNRFSAARSPA